MSYASIINNLPNKLAQPNNVSILASLGLHALLFLTLPNLSIAPGGETQRRTVQVTELSPVEQMRLPDFSPPPVAPFSFPEPSVINPPMGTPSLDLPNSTALVPPSSTPPTDTQPPVTSTFPNIPVVPLPPPPQFTLKPPPIAPAPQVQPTPPQSDTVAKLPPSNTLPTLPPNPNRTLRFPPTPPPIEARDLINQRQNDTVAKLPPPNNTLPTLPTKPNTLPTLPPNPNQTLRFPPPPLPSGTRSNNQRTAVNSAESPLPPAPPLTERAPIAPPTDTIERQREQQLVAELRQRRASLSEEQTATTNEEARKNYTYWWSAVKAETKPEELSLAGTYPLDACVKKLEGTTVYGVVVNAQGSVVNTELIKGAGYPIFNNQALEQLKGRSFLNPTGNPKPYLVNVNYKYSSEVCPSLSIAPPKPASESVAEEPAPTSTPTPAPESTQSPQPSKPDSATETPTPAPEATEPQSTQDPATPTAPPEPAPSQEAPAAPPTSATPAPEKPQAKPAPAPAQRQEAPVAPTPPNAPPASQSPSETLGGPINSPNPLMQPKPARNTPEGSEEENTTPENKE